MSHAAPGAPEPGEMPKASRVSDLPLRFASALVMIALAITTTWFGGHVFTLFWLAAALAICFEWQTMCGGPQVTRRFLAGAVALCAAAPLAMRGETLFAILAICAGAVVAGALAPPALRAWSAAGVAYAGALVVAVGVLRGALLLGEVAIFWLFATVWATDIFAYFGGRSIGGPKLWPRVSPSKTWSGFVCGVASGMLCGLAIAPLGSNVAIVAGLGLAVAILSQGGDLFESSVKRHFGVKDAGALIPGHGGVMDRLDGFIAAAVFAATIGAVHSGIANSAAGLFFW